MTWGRGHGQPWGGGPLVEPSKATSEIAGDPVTFDLSDEPDGVLPGLWEFYALDVDASGNVTVLAEPSPSSFYQVKDGLGFWKYSRAPALPGPTDPFSEQGVGASPSSILVGRNARAAVIFTSPTDLLDETADEFFYEVVLGLRFDPVAYTFVGARARARWQAGAWVEPVALEVIQASGKAPVVLAAATIEPEPDPADLWRVSPQAELEIELRGGTLTATLGGVLTASAAVPEDGPARPLLEVRAYTRQGAFLSPHPTWSALQLQSLRDLERLGPPAQIPGDVDMEAPTLPMLRLPIQELLDLDPPLLKRKGARRFVATEDFVATVDELRFLVREGEVLHAREKFGTQNLVPVTRDLTIQRGRGGL